MRETVGLILAAGEGTRMRSDLVKVLHPLWGRPMVTYPVELCLRLPCKRVLVVICHQAERVQETLAAWPVECLHQGEPKGTAHAVAQAEGALAGFDGTLLVLTGDTPLLREETVRGLIAAHEGHGAEATILTARVEGPAGYGRIIRDRGGKVIRIVEEVEASAKEKRTNEINAGIYSFAAPALFAALRDVPASAVKGEFFLPEVIRVLVEQGSRVEAVAAPDPKEVLGINTRRELTSALGILRERLVAGLLAGGVTLLDPQSVYLDVQVTVGQDTVLYPGVILQGNTSVGERCVLYPGVRLRDTRVAEGVTVLDGSVIVESDIGAGCTIGPYAHLRPGSALADRVKVGNFCELKQVRIGTGSKVPHLSYVGDCEIGADVNVGAGTITCNYDGFTKHRTVIEDGVFVGSNVSLVAPVRIGRGAIIAAGSTITEDIPPGALAFGRSPQVTKPDRAQATRAKLGGSTRGKGSHPR